MELNLDEKYQAFQEEVREFVDMEIVPNAKKYDEEQLLPRELIDKLADKGYLSAVIPKKFGGSQLDNVCIAILNEEVGRGCSSTRSLLTVHGMCALGILRWGSNDLKERYLKDLASGKKIGAFALTEPDIGSNAREISTTAVEDGDYYVLNGEKKWITMAQIADVFILYAKCEGVPTAFLVDRNIEGLDIEPINDLLGCRASMIGRIKLNNCKVKKENLIGKIGTGLSHVALTCLDYGRFTIGCGCVGIAQACLEDSIEYSSQRQQFGHYIKDNQLIQKMISEMVVNTKAARLLCYNAAILKDNLEPDSIMETWNAKYFASKVLMQIATDALQIHGGNGVSKNYNVERYYRDAKINEIIEGSSQIHEVLIAKNAYKG